MWISETCTSKKHAQWSSKAQSNWSSVCMQTCMHAAHTHHGHQANTLTAQGLPMIFGAPIDRPSQCIHTNTQSANRDPGGPLGSYYRGVQERKRETTHIHGGLSSTPSWIAEAAHCDVSMRMLVITGSSSKRHGSAKHSHGSARDMAVH